MPRANDPREYFEVHCTSKEKEYLRALAAEYGMKMGAFTALLLFGPDNDIRNIGLDAIKKKITKQTPSAIVIPTPTSKTRTRTRKRTWRDIKTTWRDI